MAVEFSRLLGDEQATTNIGQTIAECLELPLVVYLEGDLGSGKTTLSRGLIRALGVVGAIKSPTYTLVEPYTAALGNIYHFDLYRLEDPEELEFIGIREYLAEPALWLVEWPGRGDGMIPVADVRLQLSLAGEGRSLLMTAGTIAGKRLLSKIMKRIE